MSGKCKMLTCTESLLQLYELPDDNFEGIISFLKKRKYKFCSSKILIKRNWKKKEDGCQMLLTYTDIYIHGCFKKSPHIFLFLSYYMFPRWIFQKFFFTFYAIYCMYIQLLSVVFFSSYDKPLQKGFFLKGNERQKKVSTFFWNSKRITWS